uniref:Endocuticle structural glycoprotein SgAbd-2 n=2 Tax=Lygus hesperus TaxID=30085 RepID=A0A146L0M8_LYGHE
MVTGGGGFGVPSRVVVYKDISAGDGGSPAHLTINAIMLKTKLFSCAVVALLASATARPQGDPAATTPIAIIKYENPGVNYDGSYKWNYETANEIVAQEEGFVQNFGQGEDKEIQTAVGSYSYTAPDGVRITVTYRADENGFVAQGDHLPTPPPVPAAIQRALDFIAKMAQVSQNSAKR